MVVVKEKDVKYPMISTKTWWNLRKQFTRTMPSRLIENNIASLLGMEPRSVQVNIFNPLRKMGLIDDDSKPTERARHWLDDDLYPQVCEEIRKQIYPSDLLATFPDPDSPRASIEKWFARDANVGESAKGKMALVYLLLMKADPTEQINSSRSPRQQKTSVLSAISKAPTKRINASKSKDEAKDSETPEPMSPISIGNKSNVTSSLHIDIQIHISPDASLEQIDHIFASMGKYLYKGE